MKLALKREDIGVYITFTLGGVGIGLLVAAYLDSIRAEKQDEQLEEEAAVAWKEYVDLPEVTEDILKTVADAAQPVNELEQFADVLTADEYDLFINKIMPNYSPTAPQLALLMSGAINLEEFESLLISTKDEPRRVNYVDMYQKPDLDEVVLSDTMVSALLREDISDEDDEFDFPMVEYPHVFDNDMWVASDSNEWPQFVNKVVRLVYEEEQDIWARNIRQGQNVQIPDPGRFVPMEILDQCIDWLSFVEDLDLLWLYNQDEEKLYSVAVAAVKEHDRDVRETPRRPQRPEESEE